MDKNNHMDIIDQLKKLSNDNNMSLDELSTLIAKDSRKVEEEKLHNNVQKNEQYVGRCFYNIVNKSHSMFPEMKKFYLVISGRSENEYRVECLTFKEQPTYWFDYQMHKMNFVGDYYLGKFEFESFETESIMVSSLKLMTEISREEFNKYAKEYLDKLLNLEWIEDHYRWGGVLPDDPKWKIHDLKEAIEIEKES